MIATRPLVVKDIDKKKTSDFLYDYGLYNSPFLKTIYIINNNGQVFSSKQVKYDIIGNKHLKRIYDMAVNNYRGVIWTEPYYTPLSGQTVAFALPIKDSDNQINGVAVVETNLEYLTKKMAPWLVNKGQSFIIMSSADNVVVYDKESNILPYQEKVYPKILKQEVVNKLTGQSSGIEELDLDNRTYVTFKSRENSLGWRLLMIIDQKVFYLSVQKLYSNFYLTALLWIGILLAGSLLFSFFFTWPIRKLVIQMDRVQDFNKLHSIQVDREDEIGRLAISYNAMMNRINKLISDVKNAERLKKEYELKMLQSQIGPHFLYNTLACIGSLSKQGKIKEVRKTIKSLVQLLSFSFDKRDSMVTLAEEMDGVEAYVNIQKIRYGDKVSLSIDIEGELYQCKVLKLSLQPII